MVHEVKHLLHLENVYQSYGSKLILDNIDLTVSAGELCTVVGPSGCGKSTLLRLIVGQEQPHSGTVLIEGKSVGIPDKRRGIVYQKYSLFPHLTVLENILLGKRLTLGSFEWRKQKRQISEEALEFLKKVHLQEHRNKYPHELSGGMQQRVSIVQTLIMKPDIVLMDEPFGALDPETREQLQIFLLELWENHPMTIFFVTHNLMEAVYLGTRILVLSHNYSDDRGHAPEVRRGARIVADYPLERVASSTTIKSSKVFTDLVQQIRKEGFDPKSTTHVSAFNLKHKDSFQTLTPEEHAP
ncbi:MAG: ABC transporter ATP-binding protein [Oligoflexia bacterium]|nr:ABC transporter ATP-binding protein [Oligoflexia bacterium]